MLVALPEQKGEAASRMATMATHMLLSFAHAVLRLHPSTEWVLTTLTHVAIQP